MKDALRYSIATALIVTYVQLVAGAILLAVRRAWKDTKSLWEATNGKR